MDEAASDGKMQYEVLSRESIEILLEILDAIDRLDDDNLVVIENLVKTLPPHIRADLVPRRNVSDGRRDLASTSVEAEP